jgi:SAM-dependent methyltransferase
MKIWSFAKRAFMTFWYGYVKNLNLILPSITIQGKRLIVFPDVYKPLENEYACADYCREGDRMLDLGCGSGIGAVVCAPKVRELVAVDISPSAVKNTEENCRLNRLHLAEDGRLLIQFPMWFRGRIERLGAEQGLKLVEVRRLPLKSPALLLLSLLYMQFGFRSAFYLLQPVRKAEETKLAA